MIVNQLSMNSLVLLHQGSDPVHELPEGQPRQFDICIANILRGPLLELQPRLSDYVRPNGQLLLSGILTSQVSELCIYAAPFVHSFPCWFNHAAILCTCQAVSGLGSGAKT